MTAANPTSGAGARSVHAEARRPAIAVGSGGMDFSKLAAREGCEFPTMVLPRALRDYAEASAEAMRCEPALLAAPMLAVACGAIGTTRAIELKPDWREFPVLWVAVVMRSGGLKSPTLKRVAGPLFAWQAQRKAEYDAAMRDYLRAKREWEKASRRKNSEPGDEPGPPVLPRCVTSDATIEAVASILSESPRLVIVRDELAGLLRGLGQYKRVSSGDVEAFLELWSGGTLVVDRKTSEPRLMIVRNAAASIVGTIQPGALDRIFTPELRENGLAGRFVLVMPDQVRKQWSLEAASPAVRQAYERTILALLSLAPGPDGGPVVLSMERGAEQVWAHFYNEVAEQIHEAPTDFEAAVWSKTEAHGARLALLFELCDHPDATEVGAGAMAAGTALARYLAFETLRVHDALQVLDEARDIEAAVTFAQRRGGRTTPRELAKDGPRRLRGSVETAREVLDAAVEAGRMRQVRREPGRQGGRPTIEYELVRSRPAMKPVEVAPDLHGDWRRNPAGTSPEGVSSPVASRHRCNAQRATRSAPTDGPAEVDRSGLVVAAKRGTVDGQVAGPVVAPEHRGDETGGDETCGIRPDQLVTYLGGTADVDPVVLEIAGLPPEAFDSDGQRAPNMGS